MADNGAHPTDLFVGSRIRARRKSLGVSQQSLAEDLGLTFQQVQKYERGANRVSASKLHDIATTLKAPIEYFFDGLERHAEAAEMHAGLDAFLNSPEGSSVLESWPKLSRPLQRAAAALMREMAMASDGDGAERT